MKTTFSKAIKIAIIYYKSNGYAKNKVDTFLSAIKIINIFPKCMEINSKESKNWLSEKEKELGHARFKTLRNAIYLLNSIIENGKVITTDFVYNSSPDYKKLNNAYRLDLDEFLVSYSNLNNNLTDKYIGCIRQKCSNILYKLQMKGILSPLQINFLSLKFLCADGNLNNHISRKSNNIYNSIAARFIKFIEQKYNKPITLHYMLNFVKVKNLVFLEELDFNKRQLIIECEKNSIELSGFNTLKIQFLKNIKKLRYAKNMIKSSKDFIESFQFFMDANNLHYSIGMMETWLQVTKDINPISRWGTFERNLFLFKQLCKNHEIDCTKLRKTTIIKYNPPDWSNKLLNEFLSEKIDEDKQKSTISMYRASIGRFLCYLDTISITAFSEITFQIIVDYQIQDLHKSLEGKYAYMVRVRNFFRFLARRKLINNTLEFAFRLNTAPQIKIIKALDDKQKKSLYNFVETALTPMEYRISAMLILALHLGLRSVDINNLKFGDINWKTQTITIIQQKTNIPVKLPFPNIVGNTLSRYILKGRPSVNIDYPYVFIKHHVPYNRLHKNVITPQLKDIMKHYDCSSNVGSHTLRRNYATELLKNSTNFHLITSALGQVSSDSVVSYLALDSERMKGCALSLEGIELGGTDNAQI
jgi:site-specific recombinase XerD